METDKETFKLIKQALENYEEEYIPGSWENFVNKQKKRKKIILWKLGTGIAASFLFGGLAFYSLKLTNNDNPVSDERQITTNETHTHIPDRKDIKNPSDDNSSDLKNGLHATTGKKTSYILKFPEETNVTGVNSKPGKDIHKANNDVISTKTANLTESLTFLPAYDISKTFDKLKSPSEKIPDPLKISLQPDDEEDPENKFIPEPTDFYPGEENNKNELTAKRKIRFGINLSPGVNSTQTANALYFSGGISTSFVFYKNFELSTGLQVEHQSVVNGPHANNVGLLVDETRADLINLDLPINITWKFFSNSSKSYYISGGLSSLAYLSENYENTTYTQEIREFVIMEGGQETVSYDLVNVESTTQNSVSSFQSFDVAGRINIILGLEQHLSGKISLHIEPYLKIPISEMTTENLKFTTSGITCKISF